jgi:hypothetical protein
MYSIRTYSRTGWSFWRRPAVIWLAGYSFTFCVRFPSWFPLQSPGPKSAQCRSCITLRPGNGLSVTKGSLPRILGPKKEEQKEATGNCTGIKRNFVTCQSSSARFPLHP